MSEWPNKPPRCPTRSVDFCPRSVGICRNRPGSTHRVRAQGVRIAIDALGDLPESFIRRIVPELTAKCQRRRCSTLQENAECRIQNIEFDTGAVPVCLSMVAQIAV